jgi:uncharacterized protein YbaR (Trm112 family)
MGLNPQILSMLDEGVLVDPETREALVQSEDGHWLEARETGRRFPVRGGIPRLLAEAAEPLGSDNTLPDSPGT